MVVSPLLLLFSFEVILLVSVVPIFSPLSVNWDGSDELIGIMIRLFFPLRKGILETCSICRFNALLLI